jgi:hypothetical protein
MNIKEAVVGVVTLVIGGTVYSVSQSDIIDNFADDTGLTQEQAEEYVNTIEEDELFTFDELGILYIEDGENLLEIAIEIDCPNYEYEWESSTLSCDQGKEQLNKFGNDSISLGQTYRTLDTDSASEEDISVVISFLDVVKEDYDYEIIKVLLEDEMIEEEKKTLSYNKAILETVLESD